MLKRLGYVEQKKEYDGFLWDEFHPVGIERKNDAPPRMVDEAQKGKEGSKKMVDTKKKDDRKFEVITKDIDEKDCKRIADLVAEKNKLFEIKKQTETRINSINEIAAYTLRAYLDEKLEEQSFQVDTDLKKLVIRRPMKEQKEENHVDELKEKASELEQHKNDDKDKN